MNRINKSRKYLYNMYAVINKSTAEFKILDQFGNRIVNDINICREFLRSEKIVKYADQYAFIKFEVVK